MTYHPDGIGGKIIDLDFNARSWNPVTPDGLYYGKGAFVESVAGAIERKKATGKKVYIYEGASSTREDPNYVLDKKYSRNKRSVGHTNNPLWRNPQPTITIEGQRFEVLYSLSLEEAKRMGRQLGGKVGRKTIARELILRKPKGKLIKAVALDDKGEIISRPYQPSLAGLPRDVIDRFLTLKAFKGPRRNPQQLSFEEPYE